MVSDDSMMSSSSLYPPLGCRIVALARESLTIQRAMSYRLVSEWATDFLDPLLKAADALVLNDGRIYTRNGRVALTCNVPWAIHSTLKEFANQVIAISDWQLATLQQAVIESFEESIGQVEWLELLDGTAYYRCYPLPYGQVISPIKPDLCSPLAMQAISSVTALATSEINRRALTAMGHSREEQGRFLKFLASLVLVNGGA